MHLDVFQHLIFNINNSSSEYQRPQIKILQDLTRLYLTPKIIIVIIFMCEIIKLI